MAAFFINYMLPQIDIIGEIRFRNFTNPENSHQVSPFFQKFLHNCFLVNKTGALICQSNSLIDYALHIIG